MFHGDEEMCFDFHHDNCKASIAGKNAESDLYFLHQAQHMHALAVWGGSQDLISAVLTLANAAKTLDAKYHLQYGLGRRSQAIWRAFRAIYFQIAPDRVLPLAMDDTTQASNDLNAIYLNIRGALDNFAWALQYSLVGTQVQKLHETQIGLFNLNFLKQPEMREVNVAVTPYKQWNTEFKERRDPAAHRVPLSIIPSIQNQNSLAELQEIDSNINKKTVNALQAANISQHQQSQLLFAEVEELHAQREKIGSFYPYFECDPSKPPIFLYPTLPADVGIYVVIARKMITILKAHFAESKSL